MRASLSRSVRMICTPDLRSALAQLRTDGLWVGFAGNRTGRAGGILRELGLPADMIATSDDWGVSKPDPGFFRQMLEARYRGPDGKLRPAPSTFQRKTDAARYLRPRGAWPRDGAA